MIISERESKRDKTGPINREFVKNALQKKALIYDKAGEERCNLISAFHKSLRGGNSDAAVYWLGRMLAAEEDPFYVARRIVRFASDPKSNSIYAAYGPAKEIIENSGSLPVPLHIRNAPTKLMRDLGCGKNYKYAHDYKGQKFTN